MSESNYYGDSKGWSGSSYAFLDSDGWWAFSDNKVVGSTVNICLHVDGCLPDRKIARFGTHAILYDNNQMGDRDLTWCICEIFKGEWVLEGNDPLLQYHGDTIIKIQPLFELAHKDKS